MILPMLRRLLIVTLLALLALLAVQRFVFKPPASALGRSFAATAPPPQNNQAEAGIRTAARLGPEGVEVTWEGPRVSVAEATLYRSTSDLARTKLNNVRFPIATRALPAARAGRIVDDGVPSGVTVHYQVRLAEASGRVHYGPVVAVNLPAKDLPRVANPSLLVDKADYYLEVRDGGRPVKRYPIALGRNPFKRKLHEDNASTPEGRYRILNLQPQATFYRAYDLDYPTATDRERYDLAAGRGELPQPAPGIGGEIQIHGKGIQANWTYGCIALRDEDMDELFAHPEIAVGCPVEIVGREFTRANL